MDWLEPGRPASHGWFLGFYDFRQELESVAGLVPGVGDVLARAHRNEARDGTPFFVAPSGRADPMVNAFWRAPGVRGLAEGSKRRYAFSLKVWLDFLAAVDMGWRSAGRRELEAFKEWRLSIEDNSQYVAPGSFKVDLAAIRRFYLWAADHSDVENPVLLRVLRQSSGRGERAALEATPAGIRRADVKWLTPQAFRLWHNVGLRGFTAVGLPDPRWRGRTEDRDAAFVEGLFGTGLRLGEWSSRLTVESLPVGGEGLVRCTLAAGCAKGGVGRPFWMPCKVAQSTQFYVEEGSRPAAVARAQREGRYEQIRNRWLVNQARPDGVLRVVDPSGRARTVQADALSPRVRMRLFRETAGGLEPLWLWLNDDGMPRPKQAWHKTFSRANARVERVLAVGESAGRLWARPHMMRHSFALRWYGIASFVAWQRTAMLSEAERRDFRNQLGDVWFLLATLLGHRSAETTRQVYLEPFQAVQVEQLVALLDADDRAALDRLAETLGVGEPRVLRAVAL